MRLSVRRRWILGLGPGLAAALAVAAVGSSPSTGSAADPFQAGQVSTASSQLRPDQAAVLVDRAARTGRALGLPTATRRSTARVADRFSQSTYDEATDLDRGGQATAVQRFSMDGRMLAAVRFGGPPTAARSVGDAPGAIARGRAVATAVGLADTVAALGQPTARAAAEGGWVVSFARSVSGVPVPGDGLRIELWPDGSVRRLARSERQLAAAPARAISLEDARAIAERTLDGWYAGEKRAAVSVASVRLAWVAPNDTFASSGPDAPAPVLRLAWAVDVSVSGELAEQLSGLEIDLDAGTGIVLGGDVLQ